jgi:hypothetical protein
VSSNVGARTDSPVRALKAPERQNMRMTRAGLLLTSCVCLALTSCSRKDSLFSGAPEFSAASQQGLGSVVECIADRWERSTRHLRRARVGSAVRLQGRSFFRGVPIGVQAWHAAGHTQVQFFEARATDRIYLLSIKDCLR